MVFLANINFLRDIRLTSPDNDDILLIDKSKTLKFYNFDIPLIT